MHDLRYALRSLLKSPGFTAVAVLSLALGIGLNTSMFTMVNGVFLRPLAYPRADQLVRVYRTTPQTQSAPHSIANYLDLARESADTVRLAGFRLWSFTVVEPGRAPRMLNGMRVTAAYFPILGVQPKLGRYFTDDENRPGANNVAILSHDLWATEFGADPMIIGRTVRLDGQPTTIVGVMPDSFSSLVTWGPTEIWCPYGFTAEEQRNRAAAELQVMGRRAPGLTLAHAEERLRAVAAQIARDHPAENTESSVLLRPLRSSGIMDTVDTFRQISWLTLALAGSVLLITCANLANLQLGRALRRAREYAVCSALGASRWRLMRPLLCECLLLAFAGAAAGMLIVLWANDWIAFRFRELPGVGLPIDWHVLTFAFGATLLAAVLFGVAPAWLVSRLRVNEVLKSGSRGATGGVAQSRVRSLLIIGQFALALLLLSGAGFFERGTARLIARDVGWKPAGILQGILSLPASRYSDPGRAYGFYRRLEEKLAALPGVEHVGVGWTIPVFEYLQTRSVTLEGRNAPPAGREPLAYVNGITPSFLPTIGLKLVRGRCFAETDDAKSPGVVLINETMARSLFSGESPLGRRLRLMDGTTPVWLEIVGVVADVRFAATFGAPATVFQIYRPLAQDTWNYVTVAVRTATSPATLAESFRQAVAGLDADLPVQRLATGPAAIEEIVSNFAFGGRLLSGLAALGLFLAALGIYGVIANLVEQRTPEIGIRLALGAPIHSVMWLALGTGVRLTLVGVGLGLAGTYALAQLLRAIAPSLPAQDTAVAVIVTAILMAVALLACWLPARRATRIDPVEALRAE
jgi:predicted permease